MSYGGQRRLRDYDKKLEEIRAEYFADVLAAEADGASNVIRGLTVEDVLGTKLICRPKRTVGGQWGS